MEEDLDDVLLKTNILLIEIALAKEQRHSFTPKKVAAHSYTFSCCILKFLWRGFVRVLSFTFELIQVKYLIRANNFNATMEKKNRMTNKQEHKIWYIAELKARVGSSNTTLPMGTIFNWVSKVIKETFSDCLGYFFVLTVSVNGLGNSHPPLHQSDATLKPVIGAFPRFGYNPQITCQHSSDVISNIFQQQ